jgi:hypothetical protein
MQLKLFIVPVKNLSLPEGEMNAFLRSHRVLAVRKEFVSDGENSLPWQIRGRKPPGASRLAEPAEDSGRKHFSETSN